MKNILYLFSLIILILLLIFGIISLYRNSRNSYKEISSTYTEDLKIKDQNSIAKFINFLGWEVEKEPIEVVEVLIPKNFDQVYENYNYLQKLSGFDLDKYRGKKVTRYTYKVLNFPDKNEDVRINILRYNDTIIGGDIMTPAIDGFMYPLIFNVSAKYNEDSY
jgi:hypothetical protein